MLILYKIVTFKNGLETCHPYSNIGLFCVHSDTALGGHFETEKIHCKILLSKTEIMPVNFKNSPG